LRKWLEIVAVEERQSVKMRESGDVLRQSSQGYVVVKVEVFEG